jgi:NTE family protein
VVLSYRPGLEEPGPEKSFDLSADALAQRWIAGVLDMEHAENSDRGDEIALVRRGQKTPDEAGNGKAYTAFTAR